MSLIINKIRAFLLLIVSSFILFPLSATGYYYHPNYYYPGNSYYHPANYYGGGGYHPYMRTRVMTFPMTTQTYWYGGHVQQNPYYNYGRTGCYHSGNTLRCW